MVPDEAKRAGTTAKTKTMTESSAAQDTETKQGGRTHSGTRVRRREGGRFAGRRSKPR